MTEKLSWDEIKLRYPDEWVAMVDFEWADNAEPIAGVVYAHHPDKKQLLVLQRGPKEAAIVWTGKKRGAVLMAAVDVD